MPNNIVYVSQSNLAEFASKLTNRYKQGIFATKSQAGSPIPIVDPTDFDTIASSEDKLNTYVYLGETTPSYTHGHLYYWVDDGWVDGESTIVANPTLQGSEQPLNTIEIYGNKYIIPGRVYENLPPSQGGTDISLVTTGEKYIWNSKQDKLVNQSNLKSVNNSSLLGSGNLQVGNIAYEELHTVQTNIVNGTIVGDKFVGTSMEAELTILPSAGYQLPVSISVVGTTYQYDNTTGIIILMGTSNPVSVSAECTTI